MRLSLAAIAALVASPAMAAPAFDVSGSYVPRSELAPGYYACRSGLDFDSFTFTFDLAADGSYRMRGQDGEGRLVMSPVDGVISFESGPFASDESTETYARNATRVSDGNAVIIIRYDFGDEVTDDYCALVE